MRLRKLKYYSHEALAVLTVHRSLLLRTSTRKKPQNEQTKGETTGYETNLMGSIGKEASTKCLIFQQAYS
jgi:hypothetical protein